MAIRIRVFMAKLKQFFRHQQTNGELEDEIQLHVQMLKERFILQGMVPYSDFCRGEASII